MTLYHNIAAFSTGKIIYIYNSILFFPLPPFPPHGYCAELVPASRPHFPVCSLSFGLHGAFPAAYRVFLPTAIAPSSSASPSLPTVPSLSVPSACFPVYSLLRFALSFPAVHNAMPSLFRLALSLATSLSFTSHAPVPAVHNVALSSSPPRPHFQLLPP